MSFALATTSTTALAQTEQTPAPAGPDVNALYGVQAALQDAARSKFTDLVRAADPAGYGARLGRLEDRLNDYLKRFGHDMLGAMLEDNVYEFINLRYRCLPVNALPWGVDIE